MFFKKLKIKSIIVSVCILFFFISAVSLQAGDLDKKIKKLRLEIKKKNYTFRVGRTAVSRIPLELLCGLREPKGWRKKEKFERLKAAEVLPSRFDWRDEGKVTAVKHQGNCGSCWAFATIGSYESVLLVAGEPSGDLSEQFLLDCNTQGYDCTGGWFDYRDMGDGTPEESCYPYIAVKCECETGCDKHYPVASWSYIAGASGIPAVDDIKNVILNHGPVSAAVVADDNFKHYTGGIYNHDAGGSVNHAIVLVGWDDDGGYWILKNSWGTDWGESGYMMIRYGVSKVGYAACYATPSR